MGKLKNEGHERFCQEYVKDLNQTQAYIRAGYEEKAAAVGASKLVTKSNIQERIQELQIRISERNNVQASDIAAEFMKIGFSNITNYFNDDGSLKDLSDLPKEMTAAISGIKIRDVGKGKKEIDLKLYSKEKSLEALGKHIGWFEKDNKQKEITIGKIEIVKPE